MVRVCVAVIWIVAWTAVVAAARIAKVTKCCPRDTILKIDMVSCVGFAADDMDRRGESYVWSTADNNDTGVVVSPAFNEDLMLSVSNSSSIPWWIPEDMEFLRASNLSETFDPDVESFDANGRLPCPRNDRDAVIINEDVAVLDNGRIIVLSQAGHESLTFTSDEYCIDRVSLLENFTVAGGGPNKNGKIRRAATTTNATTAIRTYTYVVLVCRPCARITCVPKCCAHGFVLESQKIIGCRKLMPMANVTANAVIHLKAANGTELKSKDYYFYGMKPPNCGPRKWYIVNNQSVLRPDTIGYGLLPDGRMLVDGGVMPIERDRYCVDAMQVMPDPFAPSGTPIKYTDVLLACRLGSIRLAGTSIADNDPLEFREILYGTYFVVGTIFLAATLFIYAVLPELRVTVHSGNLIAHTVCLFVSYATLAATTLVRNMFGYCSCVVAGFVIQFSFLAAFFWLNVMCADIAWTFSEFRLLLYSNTIENEKKKYIVYSIYAWGSSIVITILTAVAEFTTLIDDHRYKPDFGLKECWFSNKLSVGVFFYLPIGLLLLTNFILFLFTAFRIVFIRRDTSKVLNRQTNQNNMRLSLYLKLFCLMGVTFVFEVISWAVDAPAYYWYATDAVNSLRGVFVFFIFCWKRSVLNLLLGRSPDRLRERIIRTFGIRATHRYPSFSSTCPTHMHLGGSSVRTHSTSVFASQNTIGGSGGSGGSSFQLSQFGGPASRKNSSARQ